MKKIFIALPVILLLVLLLPACSGTPAPAGPALKSVSVDAQTISLKVGATQQLKITATFEDGSTKDVTAACTYSSSVPAVAAVSAAGLITASAAGAAYVGAAYRSGSAIVQITVLVWVSQ